MLSLQTVYPFQNRKANFDQKHKYPLVKEIQARSKGMCLSLIVEK